MIQSFIYAGEGQKLVNSAPDELAHWHQVPGAMIWVDLATPSSEELRDIASIFKLIDLTVEDFLHQGQRAKLESFDGYNVLIMHGMTFDATTCEVTVPELDVVLGKNFLITHHLQDLDGIIHDPQGADHACAQLGKGPTMALYRVVDRLVDSYYPVLEAIDDTIEALEVDVLTRADPGVLQQIFTMKHSLGFLRKVVSPQLEVFNRLIAREDEFIDPQYAVYFRDVYDHLVRTFEVVDSYRDLMSSAMDAYLSMVSNRQNEIMKRLTLFTTIFMPITFLTGLFGQNFGVMPQVKYDPGYLWWIVLGGMILISVVQLLYYRWAGWLSR
jgi:magnesium transporter